MKGGIKVNSERIYDQETILDDEYYDQETVLATDIELQNACINEMSANKEILDIGMKIDNYIIKQVLSDRGAQSNVYLVNNTADGNDYVLKLYRHGYVPSHDIITLFKKSTCPYIIKVLNDGYFKQQYYDITKYYTNGTLNDKNDLKIKFINEIVVPCLNEGLHYLNGHNEFKVNIVHGDLKPDNIYISDSMDKVVIGDFGISSLLDENGVVVDSIKGTPEYSPLTTSFYKKIIRNSSYDYASLGLILFKLNFGYSLLANMSEEEIALKWNQGLVIPSSKNSRLDTLIRGLLNSNEHDRFGYDEVKKWTQFEYINTSHKKLLSKSYNEENGEINYIFGIFDNKVYAVNSLEAMAIAMRNHWDNATKVIRRKNFYVFLDRFDTEISKKYNNLVKTKDINAVVFEFINEFSLNNTIIYKGKDLGDIYEFFNNFEQDYLLKLEFLSTGMMEEIIENRSSFKELDFKEIMNLDIENKQKMIFIKYLFDKDKNIEIFGHTLTNIEELSRLVITLNKEQISMLLDNKKLVSWLYLNGMGKDALQLLI